MPGISLTHCLCFQAWAFVLMWCMDRCCGQSGRCKEECCEATLTAMSCVAIPTLLISEVLLLIMAFRIFGEEGQHCLDHDAAEGMVHLLKHARAYVTFQLILQPLCCSCLCIVSCLGDGQGRCPCQRR